MALFERKKLLTFFIVLLVPIGFYIFFEIKKHKTGIRLKELPVLSATIIPDFSFVAHTGDTITREDIKDKILIADFFFTTCRGICPLMSSQMKKLQDYISGHPNLKSEYRLISHTVDPQVDSVETLRNYADLYEVDSTLWWLVTGEKDSIYDLAINFYKLPVSQIMKDTLEPFVHSERFVLVDKAGYIRGYYDGTDSTDVKQLMKDLVMLDIDYEINKKHRKGN